jgi:hypothetical protein
MELDLGLRVYRPRKLNTNRFGIRIIKTSMFFVVAEIKSISQQRHNGYLYLGNYCSIPCMFVS